MHFNLEICTLEGANTFYRMNPNTYHMNRVMRRKYLVTNMNAIVLKKIKVGSFFREPAGGLRVIVLREAKRKPPHTIHPAFRSISPLKTKLQVCTPYIKVGSDRDLSSINRL